MDQNLPGAVISAEIGRRVKTGRVAGRLTIAELARAIGRSETEMAAIEEGHGTLSAREIVALCRALDLKPSWFFDGLIDSRDG
jgi:transcriptional regulator with XRE-family HTH domain